MSWEKHSAWNKGVIWQMTAIATIISNNDNSDKQKNDKPGYMEVPSIWDSLSVCAGWFNILIVLEWGSFNKLHLLSDYAEGSWMTKKSNVIIVVAIYWAFAMSCLVLTQSHEII